MLKIAICDDAREVREETRNILLKYFMCKDIDYSTVQFEDGESFLEQEEAFDLVILDYDFDNSGFNGMEIARKIRERNIESTIIFLTSYEKVVFEAFEVAAYRFLVKPLDEKKLVEVMDDFLRTIENDNTLVIKAEGMTYYIKESQISYVEGDGKNCIINYINQKEPLQCKETLSNIESRLSTKKFFRCHKSFVVNLDYVDSFNKTDLRIQNDDVIMISRNKYKPFCEAYTNYIAN